MQGRLHGGRVTWRIVSTVWSEEVERSQKGGLYWGTELQDILCVWTNACASKSLEDKVSKKMYRGRGRDSPESEEISQQEGIQEEGILELWSSVRMCVSKWKVGNLAICVCVCVCRCVWCAGVYGGVCVTSGLQILRRETEKKRISDLPGSRDKLLALSTSRVLFHQLLSSLLNVLLLKKTFK